MSAQIGLIIKRIRRDRDSFGREVVAKRGLGPMTGSLLLTSLLCLAGHRSGRGAPHSRLPAADIVSSLGRVFN
jgi:hypothetical protein